MKRESSGGESGFGLDSEFRGKLSESEVSRVEIQTLAQTKASGVFRKLKRKRWRVAGSLQAYSGRAAATPPSWPPERTEDSHP